MSLISGISFTDIIDGNQAEVKVYVVTVTMMVSNEDLTEM